MLSNNNCIIFDPKYPFELFNQILRQIHLFAVVTRQKRWNNLTALICIIYRDLVQQSKIRIDKKKSAVLVL